MTLEEKQLNLFNSPETTSSSDAPSQGNTKSVLIGQTHTKNPKSIKARELTQQRKRELVAYKGGKCERCEEEYHPNVFDFHHHDHTKKKFTVSQNNMQRSWNNLLNEADKCHLLCANCHREVHTYNILKFIKL